MKKIILCLVGTSLLLAPDVNAQGIVAGTIQLNNVNQQGNVFGSGQITGKNCQLQGNIYSTNGMSLTSCRVDGQIIATGQVQLVDTTVTQDIKATGGLKLQGSKIAGNVILSGPLESANSSIAGTLTLPAGQWALTGTTVGSIRVVSSTEGSSGGNITGNNNTIVSGSRSLITTSGGVSSINGYTVKSTTTSTTVITPENTIYVDGKKVNGPGPDNYNVYQQRNLSAPTVRGPGWPASVRETDMPHSVIRLSNHTIVSGDITFEAGNGLVVLEDDARVNGAIHGGRAKRQD